MSYGEELKNLKQRIVDLNKSIEDCAKARVSGKISRLEYSHVKRSINGRIREIRKTIRMLNKHHKEAMNEQIANDE